MPAEILHWFPGLGFRPAYFPADYIGPRLDCPLPFRADDSPYAGKLDPWQPIREAGYAWGTWFPALPVGDAPQVTAASLNPAPAPGTWGGIFPPRGGWPGGGWCCNSGVPPNTELPPLAPVPIDQSGAFLGGVLIALLMIAAAWRWTDKFVEMQREAN